jgi:hypothetical protein
MKTVYQIVMWNSGNAIRLQLSALCCAVLCCAMLSDAMERIDVMLCAISCHTVECNVIA